MNALVDIDEVFNNMQDPNERKQAIGNAIYPHIKDRYGELASKITGMLLDNERVVDRFKLVTEPNYLFQRSQDAFQLLTQSAPGQDGAQTMTQQ